MLASDETLHSPEAGQDRGTAWGGLQGKEGDMRGEGTGGSRRGLGPEGRQGSGEGASVGLLRRGEGGKGGGEVPSNCSTALRHREEHGGKRV